MNGFTFFRNYYEVISDPDNGLTEEEQGRVYNAIFSRVFDGVEPDLKGACRFVYNTVIRCLEHDREIEELHNGQIEALRVELSEERSKYAEYGKKGGRPRKNPLSENENPLKTPLKPPFLQEKEGPLIEKEGEKERSKEKDQERDYTLQEREYNLPPYNPPAPKEGSEELGLKEFLDRHENVVVDNCSTASLDLDYKALGQAFQESAYLLEKPHDLSWVAKNAARILRGDYKDKPARSGAPPDGKGDLQLWQELVKALSCAKEETDYGALTYKMQDEDSIERMGELYRGLSREITEYFDPNSFLEICGMDDKDLKFERARFLKALPEIRRKIAEVQDGA